MKVKKNKKDGKTVWLIDERINGKRIRVTTGKSKALCIERYNQRLIELEKEEADGRAKLTRKRPLRNSIIEWYDRYRGTDNGFTMATTAGNNGILEAILKSDLASMNICDIDKDVVHDWILSMGNLSFNTKRNRVYMLKQFFEYEYQDDPNRNPTKGLKVPKDKTKKEKDAIKVLDDEEMEKLCKELSKERNPHNKEDPGYFNGGALIICMYQFLRAGELCGIRKKDVDLEHKILCVDSQRTYGKYSRIGSGGVVLTDPKYGSKRKMPIFPPAEKVIRKAYEKCESPESYLFTGMYGQPLTIHPLRNTLNIALERAGLPHLRLHDLRHTGISFLLRHDVPIEAVSKWAGHSSIKVTMDTYYSIVDKQIDDGVLIAYKIWE